jgi:hypothetical protein
MKVRVEYTIAVSEDACRRLSKQWGLANKRELRDFVSQHLADNGVNGFNELLSAAGESDD